MSPIPENGSAELVYIGLSPSGRGLGRTARTLDHATATAPYRTPCALLIGAINPRCALREPRFSGVFGAAPGAPLRNINACGRKCEAWIKNFRCASSYAADASGLACFQRPTRLLPSLSCPTLTPAARSAARPGSGRSWAGQRSPTRVVKRPGESAHRLRRRSERSRMTHCHAPAGGAERGRTLGESTARSATGSVKASRTTQQPTGDARPCDRGTQNRRADSRQRRDASASTTPARHARKRTHPHPRSARRRVRRPTRQPLLQHPARLALSGTVLNITVPTAFHIELMENIFGKKLRETLGDLVRDAPRASSTASTRNSSRA